MTAAQVISWAPRSPRRRLPSPAMAAASSGRKMQIASSISALHHRNVFDRNRNTIAEVDDQDRQTDRGFSRSDGQHEHRENLPDQIAEERREGDQVDVHGEQ